MSPMYVVRWAYMGSTRLSAPSLADAEAMAQSQGFQDSGIDFSSEVDGYELRSVEIVLDYGVDDGDEA